MIIDYAKPVAGEYSRILFPGRLGQYHGSYNWKTAVGPQDEYLRKCASYDCFGDSTYLPKRNSLYGIPEILIICDTLGTKPNFVYTRVSDTTYCVASSFQAESIYVDELGPDTFFVSVTRKSLSEDASQFADYLFGEPDTGFAKLRQEWDSLDAVDTDRMMIGNDLMSSEFGLSPPSLFNYGAGWPKWNITKALIERGDVDSVDYDWIDEDDLPGILNRMTIRLKARFDCIAGAFKQVKPDIKVGAFVLAASPTAYASHGYLFESALAAENIDHVGFHWYFTGGLDDHTYSPVRLNYTTTDLEFMQDGHHEDSTKFVNHHLLNEALGDIGARELLKMVVEGEIPEHRTNAEALFGYSVPAKPIEITECNSHAYADIYEYDSSNVWAPQIPVTGAMRYLGFLRTFNRLSADPDYNLEVAQQFHMNGAASNWGFLWGYDDSSCAIWENKGYDGYNADAGNDWHTPAGGGFHAPWLANLLYRNIGKWGLEYNLDAEYDTIRSIFFPRVNVDFDSVRWDFFCKTRIADERFTPDTLFTMITVDPYIGDYGVVTTVIVNRDTSENNTTVVCTLASNNSRHYDSLLVYKLDIDSAEYAQANINHYNGIWDFLPKGLTHNGFENPDDSTRYEVVSLCTTNVDQTDSVHYFTVDMEPYSFAMVKAIPKRDSVFVVLDSGWNFISIPMFTGDSTLSEIFERDSILAIDTLIVYIYGEIPWQQDTIVDTVTSIMSYDPSQDDYTNYSPYIDYRDSTNSPGMAYWVWSDSVDTVMVKGGPCYGYITEIDTGWNPIGSIMDTVDFIDNYLPDTVLLDSLSVYYWDCGSGTYRDTSTIMSTRGHWALSRCKSNLIFPDDHTDSGNNWFPNYDLEWNYELPSPPGVRDTCEMEASIEDSTITLLDRNDTSDSIEYCLLYIQRSDTTITGYTNEHGQLTHGFVDKDSITSIQVIKSGYRRYLVHPYGYKRTPTTEFLRQDVKFYGDYVVDTTCTLYVPPRARIDGIYGIPEWNSNKGYSSITTEIILTDSSYFLIQGQDPDSVYLDLCAFNRLKGTLITEKAVVDYYLGITGGYDNASAIVRHSYIDGELIGDWDNSTGVHSGSLYVDSCYIEGRIKLHDCSGGGKIYNSSFAGNNYECLKLDDRFRGKSNVNNCVFRDYSFYGVLIEDGSITFEDCDFYSSNTAVPVYNYGTVHFDGCTLDAYGASYCLYTSSNSQASGNETLLKNPGNACVYLADNINFGDERNYSNNCFVKGKATDFFYAPTKLLVQANECYFDTTVSTATYEPDDLIVEHDNESDVCRIDPSYGKIVTVNDGKTLPNVYSLHNAVPNPFNSTVSIEFDIPKETNVRFEIYNVIGDKIITLINSELGRGRYRAIWHGKDANGKEVSSGTYLYRMKTDEFDDTRKMSLIK